MGVHQHPRTGRWVAQVWNAEAKRNIQVGSFATEKEATKALALARPAKATSTTTVADWRELWLTTSTWREQTRKMHRERTSKFAAAHGTKRLSSVDRKLARNWIADWPSHHPALSAMFGAACFADDDRGQRLLIDNPFAKLTRSKVAKRDIQVDWLSDDDIAQLEEVARQVHGPILGETWACMIRFAAETGVRPGELIVLEDDDLGDGILHVRRSYSSKIARVGPPKNGRQREVVLSTRAKEAAARVPRYTGAHAATPVPVVDQFGKSIKGNEFWLPRGSRRIFSQRSGVQWRQPSLSTHWGPIRTAAGRSEMDLYELRHFCATRLLELGVRDDEVAVQLGHLDGGKLVREVYGHPNARRALDLIRETLNKANEAAA